jgi:hypothetical protein
MESDFQETDNNSTSGGLPDFQQLFATLSNHISSQTTRIQEQFQQNDIKMSNSHEAFKDEVRNEFEEFRSILARQQRFIDSTLNVSIPIPKPPTPVVSSSHSSQQVPVSIDNTVPDSDL